MKFLKAPFLLVVFYLITIHVSAQGTKIKLTINSQTELTATLVDNSSANALIGLLNDGPLTIEMHDYGNMEKVGSIGTSLPRNDEQITTEPGDIILYQGSALVIYYAPNSWNFTRLGKIDNITQDELKAVLGSGDVTVTLELANATTSTKQLERNEDLFKVYPNPANDYLKVTGLFKTITMMDLNGKEVLRSSDNIIELNDIKPGMYLLKIESENDKIATMKISIKK